MNDIFLSYHNSDRATARIFADTLEARGWSVWWDREIPLGQSYDEVIEHELTTARAAIVLWSDESVRSRWVRTEASVAATRECLVPIMIEEAPIPLEFRQIQTAMLIGWSGDTSDAEFLRLIDALEALIGAPGARRAAAAPVPALPPTTTARKPVRTSAPRRPVHWKRATMLRAGAAAAVLIAIAFIKIVGGGSSTGNADGEAANEANPAGVDAASLPSGPTQPVPDGAFEIAIGAAVSDGVPAEGAGMIEAPFSKDAYVFNARRGQRVFFRASSAPSLAQVRLELTDEQGMQVFTSCIGCGDPGVQQLTRGGRYLITVGSDSERSTGPYQFRLYDVPEPSTFNTRIGAIIRDDAPGKGAGTIESPGAQDVYTFSAAARQRVFFRTVEHGRGVEHISWVVTDEDGMEVFSTCLGCGSPGVHTLSKGGTYKMTVGSHTVWATGTYALQLISVPPPDRFNIRLSEAVRRGVPGAGAGMIETPGAEDVYVFTAAADQQIAPRMIEYTRGMEQIVWRLLDSNDMEVFRACLGCSEVGVQRLNAGGQYTLIVGNPRDLATGAYAFELTAVR